MTTKHGLEQFFPVVFTEAEFIARTYTTLLHLGFDADNSIASVCICRDEVNQSFINLVQATWGEAFNLCSLGGMFFAGKTALRVSMHHAPNTTQPARYIYYVMPHIAINSEGHLGICKRAGRTGDSTACGALIDFQNEMRQGKVTLTIDPEDIEQTALKRRLLVEISYGQIPDLLELTHIAQRASQSDLERALDDTIDLTQSDYAIISGIQIQGTDGNYVAPASFYAIVNGKRKELGV